MKSCIYSCCKNLDELSTWTYTAAVTLRTIHLVDRHFSHTHYKLQTTFFCFNYVSLTTVCQKSARTSITPNNKDDRWKHFSKCNGSLTLNLISCCIQLSLSAIKDESNMLTLAVHKDASFNTLFQCMYNSIYFCSDTLRFQTFQFFE